MDALDPRAVDPDLAPGERLGQARHLGRIELERQRLPGGGSIGVGAQRREHDAADGAQDAVVVDRLDLGQPGLDCGGGRLDRRIVAGAGRVVRGIEALDQRIGDIGGPAQRVDHRGHAIVHAGLAQIAEPGAEQHHRCRLHAALDDQPVEAVILGIALEHGGERFLDHRGIALQPGGRDGEIMDEGAAGERGRHFLDHAEAEILEGGHGVGQRQRAALGIELHAILAGLAVDGRDPHRAIARIVEPGQVQDVAGRFLGRRGGAIGRRKGLGIAQREAGGAGRPGILHQRGFHRGHPAAHHPLELIVERLGVRHRAARAQVERVAQQRDLTVLERDRPVDDLGVGGFGEQLAHRLAARGGDFVARQPDKGEQVPAEQALHQHQLGARAIGDRHGGEYEVLERIGVERRGQVVRQRSERMLHRLAGMALRIEAELALQPFQPGPEHRHLVRIGEQRGAGPQAGMDRQAGHFAAGEDRHRHDVERHAAMDRRDRVGLEQQRRFAALVEIVDRRLARGFGEDRRVKLVAGEAELVGDAAVGAPGLVAEQRHRAFLEPAEQLGTLARAHGGGVGADRALQRAPVVHGVADLGERAFELGHQAAPGARVGALHFDVDHRFALARADRFELARLVALHGDDGMDDAENDNVVGRDRARDRIDEERHVVIDDRQPHPAALLALEGLQRDLRGIGEADCGGFRDEIRRLGPLGLSEIFQLSRQRPFEQPRLERLRQRRHHAFHGSTAYASAVTGSRLVP